MEEKCLKFYQFGRRRRSDGLSIDGRFLLDAESDLREKVGQNEQDLFDVQQIFGLQSAPITIEVLRQLTVSLKNEESS